MRTSTTLVCLLGLAFTIEGALAQDANLRRRVLNDAATYCGNGPTNVPVDPSKFAPQVRLHPLEKYRPSSAEFGYSAAQLCRADGSCVAATPDVLRSAGSGDYIYNADAGRLAGAPLGADGKVAAPMYTHVIDAGATSPFVDIQYWYYYPNNGCVKLKFGFREITKHKNYIGTWCDLGVHEGDWEHIAVRVCKDNTRVHSLRYAAHSKSDYRNCAAGQCTFVEGSHPVAYSGLDSHATFFQTGIIDREELPKALFAAAPFLITCGIFNTLKLTDVAADGGALWEPWKLPNGLVPFDANQLAFNFPGRWGKKITQKSVKKLVYYDSGKSLPCGITDIFTTGAKAAADLSSALDKYLLNDGPPSPNFQGRWNTGVDMP